MSQFDDPTSQPTPTSLSPARFYQSVLEDGWQAATMPTYEDILNQHREPTAKAELLHEIADAILVASGLVGRITNDNLARLDDLFSLLECSSLEEGSGVVPVSYGVVRALAFLTISVSKEEGYLSDEEDLDICAECRRKIARLIEVQDHGAKILLRHQKSVTQKFDYDKGWDHVNFLRFAIYVSPRAIELAEGLAPQCRDKPPSWFIKYLNKGVLAPDRVAQAAGIRLAGELMEAADNVIDQQLEDQTGNSITAAAVLSLPKVVPDLKAKLDLDNTGRVWRFVSLACNDQICDGRNRTYGTASIWDQIDPQERVEIGNCAATCLLFPVGTGTEESLLTVAGALAVGRTPLLMLQQFDKETPQSSPLKPLISHAIEQVENRLKPSR